MNLALASPNFLPRDTDAFGYLVLCAGLGSLLGVLSGQPAVLLALTAIPPYLIFLARMRAGRRGAALGLMVAWAALQSLAIIALSQWQPEKAGLAVFHGPAYRATLFDWIRTGEGSEGDWRLFLPEHARHYAFFLLASTLTAGAAGILFGTVLLNYMSYYVAGLFLADAMGAHTLKLALMGWPIWSILRVVGFIAGAVAATDLTLAVLRRGRGRPLPWPGASANVLSLSLALVILDALVKALLAPAWRLALLPIVGAGSP